MKNRIALFLLLLVGFMPVSLRAQDSLMSLLDQEQEPVVDYTSATFKTTRLVIGHSCENPPKGNLLFLVTHHFGSLNSGYENLFGLKQATIRLGLEYGINDRISLGVGLNSLKNSWDGFIKVKALRQSTGARRMPVTLTVFGSTTIYSTKWEVPDRKNYFTSRLSYAMQLQLARKFGDRLSLQISPTMVHRNLVPTPKDHNTVFAVGAGGRFKLSQRVSVNVDYYYLLPDQIVTTPAYSSLSAGIDIETGGHVFQIFLTNSMGENTESIITQTTGKWANGNIFLGFNISRIFTVVKPKEFRH